MHAYLGGVRGCGGYGLHGVGRVWPVYCCGRCVFLLLYAILVCICVCACVLVHCVHQHVCARLCGCECMCVRVCKCKGVSWYAFKSVCVCVHKRDGRLRRMSEGELV